MPTPSPSQPPLLLALSGPTSSGKTTIAHALSRILPNTLIIHADDFYKTDAEIPVRDGVQNWDCAEALDLERFGKVLREVKEGGGGGDGGSVLEGLVRQGGVEGGEGEGDGVGDGVHGPTSTSDNAVNDGSFVSEATITRLRQDIPPTLSSRQIIIIEGFLLFGKSLHIHSTFSSIFDLKILLRASYEEAKKRREGRNGYVTLEGFWKDPEGYFDEVVWRGYVEEHEWIFERGDVEGRVKGDRDGLRVGPLGEGLDGVLEWVWGKLRAWSGRVEG